jgi:hypothetical protein
MPENRIITLLSDFGLSDVYVGVMKGVIAQINPALTVVDITHQIPPQNITAARFSLMNTYPYFPEGTVHIAVVDPGVGSQRRAIAFGARYTSASQVNTAFFIGPDNGLFSGVLNQMHVIGAVELTNRNYWRTAKPSTTFHGRDIFAAVGAHLASGVPLDKLGEVIDPNTLVQWAIPERITTASEIVGCIQYIDHFGNLVSNIPASDVQGKTWSVAVGDRIISSSQTYSDQPLGEVVALIGSHGWVEIAINGGNAQSQLQLSWGTSVQVLLT